MQKLDVTCSELSPDRLVAYFCSPVLDADIFAYLPHVPGLNPFLLRVGDTLAATVVERNGRLEVTEAFGQRGQRGQMATR